MGIRALFAGLHIVLSGRAVPNYNLGLTLMIYSVDKIHLIIIQAGYVKIFLLNGK